MIARLASRSHGVVTRRQLLGAGVSAAEIRHRLHSGALIAVHRGVYRAGHTAWSLDATYLAAVLACGDGAALGGRAAVHLLRLVRGPPPAPRVWTPTQRVVSGVQTRRRRLLDPRDRIVHRGVPCTSVPLTLLDAAATLSPDALAAAFHEARIRHRTREEQVLRTLGRHPKAPGRRNLLAAVLGDLPVTLSELEREFRRVLLAAGLPLPDETNHVVDQLRVDCRYRDPPLTVELDSYGYHGDRHAWEQDRRRERLAYARGDDHRRYTYGDVFEDTSFMLAELDGLLGDRLRRV